MTLRLARELMLGIVAVVAGGLFVSKGMDAVGIVCDLLGVLYMYAAVERFPAR